MSGYAVRQIPVPAAARARSTLPAIDYADAFLVETGATDGRTAKEWARAILEGAPAALRRSLRSGWRALGLRHGPTGRPGYVLGWKVRRRTPDLVLLGATSRTGMPAELLFEREPERILFCTFVRHENAAARAVWARVELGHPAVVRYLLAGAGR